MVLFWDNWIGLKSKIAFNGGYFDDAAATNISLLWSYY